MGYVENKSEAEFEVNIMLQDAVHRRLEIIGEASTKISDNFKNAHT